MEVLIMRMAPMLALTMSLLATAACSKDTQLDSIARELEATVNRCVIDVRDKTSKYETSSNCRALSEIAKRYIAAGGLKQSAPCVADLSPRPLMRRHGWPSPFQEQVIQTL